MKYIVEYCNIDRSSRLVHSAAVDIRDVTQTYIIIICQINQP